MTQIVKKIYGTDSKILKKEIPYQRNSMRFRLFILAGILLAFDTWATDIDGNRVSLSLLDSVKIDSMYSTLLDLQSIGVKRLGTNATDEAAKYIYQKTNKYIHAFLDSFPFEEASLNFRDTLFNIVATKTGQDTNLLPLLILAHYDTKPGVGINDNGTGVAALIELARNVSRLNFKRTIILAFLTGEEVTNSQGQPLFIGSNHLVNEFIQQNKSLYFVLNIDMIGEGAGNTFLCERDDSFSSFNNYSYRFADTLFELIKVYSTLTPVFSSAYGSDYIPFRQEGFVIVGLTQNDSIQDRGNTLSDSLAYINLNYYHQSASAFIGAVYYFGISESGNAVINTSKNANEIAYKPTWGYYDLLGRKIVQDRFRNRLGKSIQLWSKGRKIRFY
jgi:aminopeptidase YwaD